MSVRTEAIAQLEKYPTSPLYPARGRGERKIWRRLHHAQENLEKARKRFIEHQQLEGFSLFVMGGSRYEASSPEARFITSLTQAITTTFEHINIVHGAGPGIMDAAAQGFLQSKQQAKENGRAFSGRNFAVGLKVPWEEKRNKNTFDYYVDHGELTPRIQELIDLSSGVYVGPGALGTGFEFLTIAQLRQAKHFEPSYAIALHPSWQKIVDDCKQQWYTDRVASGQKPLMDEHDLDFFYSDSIPDVVEYIGKSYKIWEEKIGKRIRRGHFWNRKK